LFFYLYLVNVGDGIETINTNVVVLKIKISFDETRIEQMGQISPRP